MERDLLERKRARLLQRGLYSAQVEYYLREYCKQAGWIYWPPRVTQGTFPIADAKDPKFPHDCPGCGKECYWGLNRIEHRFESDAANCKRR